MQTLCVHLRNKCCCLIAKNSTFIHYKATPGFKADLTVSLEIFFQSMHLFSLQYVAVGRKVNVLQVLLAHLM